LRTAKLYAPSVGKRVHCFLCARHCNIPDGKIGFCGVRKNLDGKLFTLNYGRLTAMAADPIEKKPLNHFHPGSTVFSIATAGCNLGCLYCQNYDISQRRTVSEPYTPPEKVISMTKQSACQGLSGTYNEPTIQAEYLIDVMKMAKNEGLFTTWVSNGYLTLEAVDAVSDCLDAITVDFKGSGNQEFYRKYAMVPSSQPIFEVLKALKERNVHIEITDLIVPIPSGSSLEDVGYLANWIKDNLGEETPLHLLRFHPDYRMMNVPPTPVEMLESAWTVARDSGLIYVYLGNVQDTSYANTYCPICRTLCIDRQRLGSVKNFLKNKDHCPKCDHHINITV
jgi:pyruvate formate lyase activating enzyme